jgi:gamma-glutamyl-gamma-aminobutyrate hydrolase PuuD
MKAKRKVLVVNDRYEFYGSYHTPFAHLGEYAGNDLILDYDPESVVAAVFTGGSDVTPEVYGETRCSKTCCNPLRDEAEKKVFEKCVELNIPMFGICRGAQLMCALAGGKLCQHLNNHGGYEHKIETAGGRTLYINSYHHQMMIPPDDAEVLAWAQPHLSSVYLGGDDVKLEIEKEIEVVHFPKINGLAVQYHPELHSAWDEGWTYYQELITDFLYTSRHTVKDNEKPSMLKIA